MGKNYKKAFSLVELLVVIIVIVILSWASYLILGKYPKNTRDWVRKSDFKNIQKLLDNYSMEKGEYPIPHNYKEVTMTSGTESGITWLEWDFAGTWVLDIKWLTKLPSEPNSKNAYKYMVSKDGRFYKLITTLESNKKQYVVSNLNSKNILVMNNSWSLTIWTCSFNWVTIYDGKSLVVYRVDSSNDCEKEKWLVKCDSPNVTWNTSYNYFSCEDIVVTPNDCASEIHPSPNFPPKTYNFPFTKHWVTRILKDQEVAPSEHKTYDYSLKVSCKNNTIIDLDETRTFVCDSGYHKQWNNCIDNNQEKPCDDDIDNWSWKQYWNEETWTWSECFVTNCDLNYHKDILTNQCIPNTKACDAPKIWTVEWNWTSWSDNCNCPTWFIDDWAWWCIPEINYLNCSGSLVENGHSYWSYDVSSSEELEIEKSFSWTIANSLREDCRFTADCEDGTLKNKSEICSVICKENYSLVSWTCSSWSLIWPVVNNPPALSYTNLLQPVEDETNVWDILVQLVWTDPDYDPLVYSITNDSIWNYYVDIHNWYVYLTIKWKSIIDSWNNLPSIDAQVVDWNWWTWTLTVNIPNTILKNDAPILNLTDASYDPTKSEAALDDIVANISATDEDWDVLTYSFWTWTNNNWYYKLSSTKTNVLLTQSWADYVNEWLDLPSIKITVKDPSLAEDTKFLNLLDTNEIPTIIASISINPVKGAAYIGQEVAKFTADDWDNDELTYSLNNNSFYEILENEERIILTEAWRDRINSWWDLPSDLVISVTDPRWRTWSASLIIPKTTTITYNDCNANPNFLYWLFRIYNVPALLHEQTTKVRTTNFADIWEVFNGRRVYELSFICLNWVIVPIPPEQEKILCDIDYYLPLTTPTDGSPIAKVVVDNDMLNNSSFVDLYWDSSIDTDWWTIVNYEWTKWESASVISNEASIKEYVNFTTNYYLRVQDNDGKWSKKVKKTIFVWDSIKPQHDIVTCERVWDWKFSTNDYVGSLNPNERYDCYKPGWASSDDVSSFDISPFANSWAWAKNSWYWVYDNGDELGCSWTCTKVDYYKNWNDCLNVWIWYFSPMKNNIRNFCTNWDGWRTIYTSYRNHYKYVSAWNWENNCDWKCDAGYYKKDGKCVETEHWKYSPDKDDDQYECKNTIPSYSHYTGFNTTSTCGWECNSWYTELFGKCYTFKKVWWAWWKCNGICWTWKQTRKTICRTVQDHRIVSNSYCWVVNTETKNCSLWYCERTIWVWWTCNPGNKICWLWTQTRSVSCNDTVAPYGECNPLKKPSETKNCSINCYKWVYWPWLGCYNVAGHWTMYQNAICVNKESWAHVSDFNCNSLTKPPTKQDSCDCRLSSIKDRCWGIGSLQCFYINPGGGEQIFATRSCGLCKGYKNPNPDPYWCWDPCPNPGIPLCK